MIKNTLKAMMSLTLAAGCASDANEAPPKDETGQRQQGVRSADGTAKLLALGNATVGASALGQRNNFTVDLGTDVQVGINEMLDSLADEACLTYTIEELSENTVHAQFDFSDCLVDGAFNAIDGNLDVNITASDVGIDCEYDGDLVIDGFDFNGAWSLDINESGTGIIGGDVNILLPDGASVSVVLDGSWKGGFGLCPEITQNIQIDSPEGSLSVDFSGLDLCTGSLCGGGVSLALVGSAGSVDFDFTGTGDIALGDGFFCGEGGLDWDPLYDTDGLDGTDPVDLGDIEIPDAP